MILQESHLIVCSLVKLMGVFGGPGSDPQNESVHVKAA